MTGKHPGAPGTADPAPTPGRVSWPLFRRWVIAGLAVWLPLSVTLVVVTFLVGLLKPSLLLIPPSLRPEGPFLATLLSVALSVLVVVGTGAIAANYLGAQLIRMAEATLARIPLVRSVYGGMKKLTETVMTGDSLSFRQPVLIEFPRTGMWSIAFVTGEPIGELQELTSEPVQTVYVPTTPNPTSGFIVFVAKSEIIPLTMSVEDAMRMIISLGVVGPEERAASVRQLVGESANGA